MKITADAQPAIFVDRDGTLIEEVNFLCRVEDLRLFPYTAEAIEKLKAAGFLIIVVTNQSGIGRSIYDEAAMQSIHDAIQAALAGAIDGFYHCPHLPCDGCECRKPRIGMIDLACSDFNIDLGRSWMIGDKAIDVETGINAGIKSAMVMTGYGRTHSAELETTPAIMSENLLAAALRIIATLPSSPQPQPAEAAP